MGVLVPVATALTLEGQGTFPTPSPKPPSLWICTLELGLGILPQVLSKSEDLLPDAAGSGCGAHGQRMTLRGSSPCARSSAVASGFPLHADTAQVSTGSP